MDFLKNFNFKRKQLLIVIRSEIYIKCYTQKDSSFQVQYFYKKISLKILIRFQVKEDNLKLVFEKSLKMPKL